jgi:hypothetical protein
MALSELEWEEDYSSPVAGRGKRWKLAMEVEHVVAERNPSIVIRGVSGSGIECESGSSHGTNLNSESFATTMSPVGVTKDVSSILSAAWP